MKRLEEYKKLSTNDPTVDFVLFDFLGSSYSSIREPLLIAFAIGLADACKNKFVERFGILLPKLPGENGAFRAKLATFDALLGPQSYSVSLISRAGQITAYGSGRHQAIDFENEYKAAVELAYGNYVSKLNKKCVRRLGHFRSEHATIRQAKCRHYSYLLHDCNHEVAFFFTEWWSKNCADANALLYDLPHNGLLREVIVAHASRNDIPSERIRDLLDDPSILEEFRASGRVAALVLDAVDSGATLARYVKELQARGVNICPHIFVAISKKGHAYKFDESSITVHGLVVKQPEVSVDTCPQCALDLPHGSDAGEEYVQIRSYDLHYMLSDVGWTHEREEEVPTNIGSGYPTIPNFSLMLDRYGDWIAYKLFNGLRDAGLPEAWFLVHPDEADSTALSERILDCATDEIAVVRVPRMKIKEAQFAGDNWAEIVDSANAEPWVQQLRTIKSADAILLDIFNASGSTCGSLLSLLTHFGFTPLAYTCVIDFNPRHDADGIHGLNKLSLYDWHNPRQLHSPT